ncbi:DUF4177 domain-containing protein [Octadecabacter sp. 1_MG-2023]|uniref:DUF4177 domain-containing protein n=1 Tax=unclassified Octadecabacter TaxID=196158 RepID=UPI001C0902F4|nr:MULTISPECIES: DUF4177 domain-containing protein [unclassified Octadecabacter]MBU2992959.1 DUF4177 domain-containing protein [Octadecabacter sp. B2R22]MDO6733589.1 DUF4177 domain-containing protein [Octadecabacter sp. 1_MG-2023]
MTGFEYKVVPAPMRGLKAKGVKGTPARFANALQSVMNELGAEGWEYQRTDTLPVEERQGLTGKSTSFQNMLVFRRAIEIEDTHAAPVAALIEDQTQVEETVETPLPAQDHVEDEPAVVAQPAPETSAGPAADENTPEAQDRVDETLQAPFTFPWNNRVASQNPKKKTDDDHVAAE